VYAKLALALARDGIRYLRDTARVGGEDIAGFTREPSPTDAIDALERLADDCDAKARLFCALCLACPEQIPARMWPLWMGPPGEHLAHVAAECWLGAWLHAEPTLARARLGEHHN